MKKENKRFENSDIEEIKSKSIISYLDGLGIQAVSCNGHSYLYTAPYRNEKTASFKVDVSKNLFYDFGTGQNGDIIQLHQIIKNLSFVEAVKELKSQSFFFHCPDYVKKATNTNTNTIEMLKVKDLENKALIEYLKSRSIPYKLGKTYLKEAYYSINEKRYFALAFENCKGGYELRNLYFKGSTSPKAYTFIEGLTSSNVSIFEGFMDFLSAFVHFGKTKPLNDVIILNSLSQVNSIHSLLSKYDKAFLFFDNDKSGLEAVKTFRENFKIKVYDKSNIYENHKDFNQFISVYN